MIHLGIIPDGNRRWCKKNNYNLNDLTDHWMRLVLYYLNKSVNNKFKYLKMVNELSVYICSIDNINRNDNTKHLIFNLIRNLYQLYKCQDKLDEETIKKIKNFKNKFKLNFIGDINFLPDDIKKIIKEIQNLNSKNENAFVLNLAIAYDYNKDIINFGRNELENYNRNQSNIDLVFRSGGEKRISGFFPTKILYSELFFEKKLWPEITLNDFNKIIKKYLLRNRRYGK